MTSSPERNVSDAAPVFPRPDWNFDAVIFDMDGVITQTASAHSRAWKRMFDDFLLSHALRTGEPFREFTHEHDYRRFVDGRPRYQGVEAFLHSRGISLPRGSATDVPGADTIGGLGNRKNVLFNEIIARDGAEVYPSTVALIRELHARGFRVGVATSSRNAALVLGKTGLGPVFESVVDGFVAERFGLKGKPAPDIFLAAAAEQNVAAERAVVVEDAVSGVEAGARGGFGLVIGVARENNHEELRRHGADFVVSDLAETNLADINARVLAKRRRP